MKKLNRTKLIVALFIFAIVACVATIIVLSVLEVKAHKHDYSAQIIAPTCAEEGYTLHKCACGSSYKSDTVSALGHDYAEEFTVDLQPDCTEKGSKSKHCTRCESMSEVTGIPANGHTFGEWETRLEAKCLKEGVCSTVQSRPIKALGHDYAEEFTVDLQPDCTKKGSKSKHCSRCESTSEVTEIPANGHTFGEWETVTEKSCTEQGEYIRKCVACGEHETKYEEPLQHKLDSYGQEFCYHTVICSRCDTVMAETGHTFDDCVCNICAYKVTPTKEIEYKLNDDGKSYQVYKVTSTDEKIVIPGEYNGLPVTQIYLGSYGKDESIQFTDVIILDGVKEVTGNAFIYWRNLKNVLLPKTIEQTVGYTYSFSSDLSRVFVDARNTIYCGDGKCIVDMRNKEFVVGTVSGFIPSNGSVKNIGERAFYGRNVKKITVPQGVTHIDNNVFVDCSCLEYLSLPASVYSIGNGTFAPDIKTVIVDPSNSTFYSKDNCIIRKTGTLIYAGNNSILPDDGSIKWIDKRAFEHCNKTEIIIPQGVTLIRGYAFWYCSNLQTVQLPKTLKELEYGIFLRCSKLETINYKGTVEEWQAVEKYEGWNSGMPEDYRIICSEGIILKDGTVLPLE